MSKTLKLTVSERFTMLPIMEGFKGKLEDLAFILEDIKVLPITEEEWKLAEKKVLVVVKTPEGASVINKEELTPDSVRQDDNESWVWNDEKAGEKEVTLSDATITLVTKAIKEKSDKGEITLNDKVLITLLAKLS